MRVTGRCHCGQISFEAEIDPTQVRICHCTDCQTLTGTAFRTNVSSLPGTFVLRSGTPKIYIKTAESGNKRAHGFCPGAAHRSIRRPRAPTRRPMACGSARSTAAASGVRQSRAGAARPARGRWTSPVLSASSANPNREQHSSAKSPSMARESAVCSRKNDKRLREVSVAQRGVQPTYRLVGVTAG
jgi:hypothetical protein